MDQPAATPDERPPVSVGMHRQAQRRRQIGRWCWWGGGGLIALSILLAIFVHKGLLGIAALVAAAATAYAMLHPRMWLRRQEDDADDEDDFTEESAD